MCLAQQEHPSESDKTIGAGDNDIVIERRKINFLLEIVSLIASGLAFTLAIFLLIHGVMQGEACLPSGCLSRMWHPIFYWLSLSAFVILAVLMAYVLACGVRTINRVIRKRRLSITL